MAPYPLHRLGGYGIQLAQALLEQGRYVPRLLALNDRSQHCDLHWLDALQYLEDQSRPLMQQLAAAEGAGQLPVVTQGAARLFSSRQLRAAASLQRSSPCGRDFFECSRFSPRDLEILKRF